MQPIFNLDCLKEVWIERVCLAANKFSKVLFGGSWGQGVSSENFKNLNVQISLESKFCYFFMFDGQVKHEKKKH